MSATIDLSKLLRSQISLVLLACVGMVLIAGSLYSPFLSNPLVFDDLNIYRWPLAHYATTPLGWELRLPAYFSLAVIQTISGHIEVHRLVSFGLHCGTGLLLYAVLLRLIRGCSAQSPDVSHKIDARNHLAAAGASTLFLLHPASVYAAGYLIQRSIVLATLFSLASLFFFLRGMSSRQYTDGIVAAILTSLALLSKEHAVLLPAITLIALIIVRGDWAFRIRYGALYAGLSTPAAVFVILLSKQFILSPYETQFDSFVQQIAASPAPASPWLESVATQAELFFRYLGTWFGPQIFQMSIDTRIEATSGNGGGVWKIFYTAAFLGMGILGGVLSRAQGALKLAGFGLLYLWIQYLVNMSTVRLQEPFVIYRSYLWAPGVAMVFAACLQRIPTRLMALALVVAGVFLFAQARDRLMTLSNPLLLWEDAAAKLPDAPVLGDARIFSNLAREYLQFGRPEEAVATISRCTDYYPDYYQCVFARGAIHLFREDLDDYELAEEWLGRAIELRPDSALAHHHLGMVFEKRGQEDAAKSHYREASRLGFQGGDYRIEVMESTTGSATLYSRDRASQAK